MCAQDIAEGFSAFGFGKDDAQVAFRRTADPSARTEVFGRDDSVEGADVLSLDTGDTAIAKLLKRFLQLHRFADFGRRGPARLLSSLARDSTPALHTLGGGQRQMFFRAARDDGNNRGHVKLGAFFDGPLHAIELE